MKKLVLYFFIVYAAFTFTGCGYNTMVGLDENVQGQWAQVENAYQRRADLIPNLVETVKGAAKLEKETLESVTNARASATQMKIDPSNLNANNMAQFEAAQKKLSGALSRLLLTVEKYPDIKFNQNFRELQAQLEGTENRINVERNKFNEVVKGYNTYVRSFPQAMYAKLIGFGKKDYFESKEGSEDAPDVKF